MTGSHLTGGQNGLLSAVPVGYYGLQLFKPWSLKLGLPLDQLNFIIAQMLALFMAFVFRKVFTYKTTSVTTRHFLNLIPGVAIGYFCFGVQIFNLFVMGTLSYAAVLISSPFSVQRIVMLIALAYLSYLHLARLLLDYGSYTIDITGPMMIATQKIICFAWCVHDGGKKEDELTPEQRYYAVRKLPTLLEFYSYIFSFSSILCGPLIWYGDYIDFIEGTNFKQHADKNPNPKKDPSPVGAVIKKLSSSLFFATLLLTVAPKFHINYLLTEEFLQSSLLYKMWYLYCTTSVARYKYYFAWQLGECICNAAGLGFNGYDSETGKAKWDLCATIDIIGFELSLNFRDALVAWNKTTQVWLRRCAYERLSKRWRTLGTYILSALWHGFYPGYYFTFLLGAIVTPAARVVRKCVRTRLESKPQIIMNLYHVLTCLTTRIMMAYTVFPFVLLEFKGSFEVYKHLFFFGHIGGLLAMFVLPMLLPPPRTKSGQEHHYHNPASGDSKSANGGSNGIKRHITPSSQNGDVYKTNGLPAM